MGGRKVGVVLPTHRVDREYENIKKTISSKARQKKKEKGSEKVSFEAYVDSNRVAAVSGASDLKSAISDANFKSLTGNVKASKADPDDKFYLKQAEHMIRGGNNAMALHFVNTALQFNPNNRDAIVLLSKCHLLKLDWNSALKTADMALNFNKGDVRALIVKGESLFNVCQFEHSLLYFHRAKRNAKEKEMYNTCRRGISNCHRIILDIISMRKDIFKSPGIESYFRKLRRMTEAKQFGLIYDPLQDSETKFTIMDFVSMTHVRKKLISNTHVMKTIREEEQLTLPAVKTLVDREYAEATRKKLRQRREQEGTIPKLNLLTKAAKQASKTRAVSQVVVATVAEAHTSKHRKKKKFNRDIGRLRSDISYLNGLSKKFEKRRTDIVEDKVQSVVSRELKEGIRLLKEREVFWTLYKD